MFFVSCFRIFVGFTGKISFSYFFFFFLMTSRICLYYQFYANNTSNVICTLCLICPLDEGREYVFGVLFMVLVFSYLFVTYWVFFYQTDKLLRVILDIKINFIKRETKGCKRPLQKLGGHLNIGSKTSNDDKKRKKWSIRLRFSLN